MAHMAIRPFGDQFDGPRSVPPFPAATATPGIRQALYFGGTIPSVAATHTSSAVCLHLATAAAASGGQFCVMKTYVATPATRERNWLVVDASGQTLGRLATRIADALRGKRKPEYTPHVDTGDFVIVVNAAKIVVTGRKREQKLYRRHSGYPGGLRSRSLNDMLERRPEEVIRLAVKGMLPRNRLGRAQLRKLKVYAGPDHPHEAQKPEPMEIEA
jgi:large subunit ribosomal protein L13